MDGTVNGRTWLDHVTPEAVVISAGVHRGFSAAASGALSRANRHGMVRVDGFADGTFGVRRQVSSAKSCTYDGT